MKILFRYARVYKERKMNKCMNGTHSLQNDRHTGIIIILYLFYCYITEIFFPHEEGKITPIPIVKKIENKDRTTILKFSFYL